VRTSGVRTEDLLLVNGHLYSRSIDFRPFEESRRLGKQETVMHYSVVDFNHVCGGEIRRIFFEHALQLFQVNFCQFAALI